eukprot:Sspe_Gene.49852::Locus_27225_Transcript_1_1_Confidence_1.000_Length_724::g.49852::m.49852
MAIPWHTFLFFHHVRFTPAGSRVCVSFLYKKREGKRREKGGQGRVGGRQRRQQQNNNNNNNIAATKPLWASFLFFFFAAAPAGSKKEGKMEPHPSVLPKRALLLM